VSKPFPYRGYERHPDETYRKSVEIVEQRDGLMLTRCYETIVRSASGRLLKVLRCKLADKRMDSVHAASTTT